jgi:hypothetical protein
MEEASSRSTRNAASPVFKGAEALAQATGIERALSAWELNRHPSVCAKTAVFTGLSRSHETNQLTVIDRQLGHAKGTTAGP